MSTNSRRHIRQFVYALLSISAWSGLLVVPAATHAAAVAGDKTLRIGVAFLNQYYDPVTQGGLHAVRAGVAETLFILNKDVKAEPWLATKAEPLDEKTWRITLRSGVKFHNGEVMDADAVKASLERAIAKWPPAEKLLRIAKIRVDEATTLTIVNTGPNPILPALLADPSTAIVNAAVARAMGDDAFKQNPVLTGPFKVEQFALNKELIVVRNRGYWGAPPLADRVMLTYIPDNGSRVLAIQQGQVDIVEYLSPESVSTITSSAGLAVMSGREPVALDFMYLNQRRVPWQDARVRQAITSAIDRQSLVNVQMQGQGIAAMGPMPPILLKCSEVKGYAFDPAKAKKLLTEAGYRDHDGDGYVEKDGRPLTLTLLTYRQRPELLPIAEAIKSSLKDIGIKVDVRVVEQIRAGIQQGDWDGALWYNNMADAGEPYQPLSQFFVTGAADNRGAFSSRRVDELTAQTGLAADRKVREELACAASQAIVEEVAIVPLVYPNFNYGVSKNVIGFEPHPYFMYLVDSKIGKR